ncbi:CbtB domain-containing protein [Prosthecomicrobium hirschii]|uniref:CbtB domain-containing protein n=1 Tax=Prosthecodimorpha hirschii TaxID=665126 RepID=UPI0009F8C68A|nr:CbtB domain-containing protein [Prosthecomicrobium hirschii]MCW1841485.1 CbtB-domain containing protein [Prosthecomicrobium hirschii]
MTVSIAAASTASTETGLAEAGIDRVVALKAAAVAALMGLALVFTTGFAHPELLHNAAHDSRHAMNFPCH